ncbi:MAG: DUF885 domain-containing protein [bacterium]|nr:DUF885 domain-containing protein [Gammaproteobacteria bacterium]HIL97057.1 DUF885 domain-containing protein [Pseudomonadales bacterium]
MRRLLLTLLLCPVLAHGGSANLLDKLIIGYETFNQQEFPKPSTGQLPAMGQQDIVRRQNFYSRFLQELDEVAADNLAQSQKITLTLLKFIVHNSLQEIQFHLHENSLLADGGFHIELAYIPGSFSFLTRENYRNYLNLLSEIPRFMEENIALLRLGKNTGYIQPAVIFKGYELTYENHIVTDPLSSIFYQPFQSFPKSIPSREQEKLKVDGREAISKYVVPAYRAFARFMADEYLPATRPTLGAYALPNGLDFYQNRIDYYTTLPLTAEDVHQLGLKEVARIRVEMDSVIDTVEFNGSYAEFLQFLRTDNRFYANTATELIKQATYLSKMIDGKLPQLFGHLPRLPYTVEPVPDHLAPKYTGGRYIEPPPGGKVPGKYWVNTYNLKSRPLYVLNALTLHEAVPGHHLQVSLAEEAEHLPRFRKELYLSVFGEGWGLYSEWLGLEVGFYDDPYSNFGRLTYEMWRACRLVVDTGIHAFKWSRRQAIDYLAEHTALSIHEITTEVDRYISWPGQALAYKMGELQIKKLRTKAESELGDSFDVRAFHDLILSEGAVTLPIMETMVDGYIAEQRKAD